MVLPLDALWFAVLIILLVVFCTAYLMSVHIFWTLTIVFIVTALVLTIVSTFTKNRKEKAQLANYSAILLEYLKSHGISGDISKLVKDLGISEDEVLKILLSMEKRGTIPSGSTKAFIANK